MTSFNEGDINRAADGKFAAKQTGETDSSALGLVAEPERASAKETAEAMRQDLAQRWPTTKFSVKMGRGSSAGWVDVSYTDGPTYNQVDDAMSTYQSSQFDGMDDSYHSTGNTQWSCRGVSIERKFSPETYAKTDALKTVDEDGFMSIDAGGHREVTGSRDADLLSYRWLSQQDLSNGFPETDHNATAESQPQVDGETSAPQPVYNRDNPRYDEVSSRRITATTRSQINTGVLMSVGAHDMRHGTSPEGNPELSFNTRVLTKPGGAVRTMRTAVSYEPDDTYRVRTTYNQRGDRYGLREPIVHQDESGVYADNLSRTILSLDQVE